MKEHAVEKYLREQVELRGGLCEKHTSPGRRGVPDRLVTWRNAMDLVELKRPKGGRLSVAQKRDHAMRRARGVYVVVCSNKAEVDSYIKLRKPHWLYAPDSPVRFEEYVWREVRVD